MQLIFFTYSSGLTKLKHLTSLITIKLEKKSQQLNAHKHN